MRFSRREEITETIDIKMMTKTWKHEFRLNVNRMFVNAKYITHCGYSIENNIASDIRLSRNVCSWSCLTTMQIL